MTKAKAEPQIVVNESPIPDNIATALRSIAIAVGAWAVGKGYLEEDIASALGTVLLVLVPFVWSQIKTYKRSNQLATLAERAPDSVAVTK